MTAETGLSILMLGAAVWVFRFLLPKARREEDAFAVACALLALLVAVIGWFLFAGASVHSGT